MRFKAQLEDAKTLLAVSNALLLNGEHCAITMTCSNWNFAQPTHCSTHGGQAFAEVKASQVFSTYRLESRSNNEISFQISLAHMARAFKSSVSAHRCIVKLAKKQAQAYLSFEILENDNTVCMVQDVPVTVLTSSRLTEDFQEPQCPTPEVKLRIPPIRNFKQVIDRMRPMSDEVILRARTDGQIMLEIESEIVKITTYYNNLKPPTSDPDRVGTHLDVQQTRCRVQIKNVTKMLAGLNQLQNIKMCYLCFIRSYALVSHVILEHSLGFFTYYVPLVTEEDDDDDDSGKENSDGSSY